ncbi:MAG: class I SAM-dependent methyltransferase [Planctomycetota bacterium]
MRLFRKKPTTTGLGADLGPGDSHYRAYVGPPLDYDLVSAMVFNLLTCLGLRQDQRVLDIGCGSLRIGRLLIPYLNKGNYVGVEPNEWLVQDGICNEIGEDQIRLKEPRFSFRTDLEEFTEPLHCDFAFAQSIFSHCGLDLIRAWLQQARPHLKQTGALLGTFLVGDEDFEGSGWVYPECVEFRAETIAGLAEECGYGFDLLDWAHPRQTWALFSMPEHDKSMATNGAITWNRCQEQRTPPRHPSPAPDPPA